MSTQAVELWNQHAAGLDGIARTTNCVDSGGMALWSSIGVPVPSSYCVELLGRHQKGSTTAEGPPPARCRWIGTP